MIRKYNLFGGESPAENREIFSTLWENGAVRIESIRSWLKNPGEWYDQQEDEWVLLLKGEAELEIGSERIQMKEGDHLLIKAHTPHRVLSTGRDTWWIGVFSS